MNICIIDSGLSSEKMDDPQVFYYGLKNDEVTPGKEYAIDTIGHGTAVYSIIRRGCPKADIYVIKIFDDSYDTNEDVLVECLNFISRNINCKILHISNGISYCANIPTLLTICEKLKEKGVIIVSAFDNEGGLSYPAAFSCVIGVDMDETILCPTDYTFLDNSVVNIRGIGSEQRLPWLDKEYKVVVGSSFTAPRITVMINDIIESGTTDFLSINDTLRSRAKQVINVPNVSVNEYGFKPIRHALLIPFNKEIHSLVRYESMLPFKIEQVCDIKYSGNVGKSTADLLATEKGHLITNIDNIDWEDMFDTVVIGHLDKYMLVKPNLFSELLYKCEQYGKQIYSFDIINEDLTVPTFCANRQDVDGLLRYPFGKLRCIGKPVIGVFGTSSRQGKFTTQLFLRDSFIKCGYNVGQLGTEPASLLFGFDQMHTIGYNSEPVESGQAIRHMNYLMGLIEDKNPDVILCGGQSMTVPANYNNVNQFPITQYCALLACQPDLIVLCINPFDSEEYIARTISFIESLIETTVVALVLAPFSGDLRWGTIASHLQVITENEAMKIKQRFEAHFRKPVYFLVSELKYVFETCIESLTVE